MEIFCWKSKRYFNNWNYSFECSCYAFGHQNEIIYKLNQSHSSSCVSLVSSPLAFPLSHPHHVTWVPPIHSTFLRPSRISLAYLFPNLTHPGDQSMFIPMGVVEWRILGAMIVIFQCFFVFIHIGSQTWHSFPLHSIKFIDGWVTSLRRPFDYCKSRVVGKLLRQIHNNKQNSFFSLNHLVLFKFSFLYSPWEPVIILCRGGGWGGF